MFLAWNASVDLRDNFNGQRLKSVMGPIGLQLEATEYLIKLAQYFAKHLSLHSFGIVGSDETGTRLQMQRRLATQEPPNVMAQSAFADTVSVNKFETPALRV